jgi:hypothetical protein
MTHCVDLLVDAGIVMLSEAQTDAPWPTEVASLREFCVNE